MAAGKTQRRVVVSVINDITTDQRVRRSCALMHEMGFEVVLVGRRLPGSPPLPERPYRMRRFRLPVNRGPFFYALFNLRLFLFLLFRRASLLYANDLDTLMPNAIVGRWKRIPLIYDSHELFTEVPEIQGRGWVKRTWTAIERKYCRFATALVTVNGSIATELNQRYGVEPVVVRNIAEGFQSGHLPTRRDLGLPDDRKVLILQGSGINIDRGAEEMVLAMRDLPACMLVIAGSGDVVPVLKGMVESEGLHDRVLFLPRQPYDKLMAYTANADLGLSLDKASNLNYKYSLPNKLFDYIHAGIPVLVSELPEVAGIVRRYEIGAVVSGHGPQALAAAVGDALSSADRYATWRQNTRRAAKELNWEKESEVLRTLLASTLSPGRSKEAR